jgi:hypothetical protein
MTRDENIHFIIQAVMDIEGVRVDPEYFKDWSDKKVEEEVSWMDYLLDK